MFWSKQDVRYGSRNEPQQFAFEVKGGKPMMHGQDHTATCLGNHCTDGLAYIYGAVFSRLRVVNVQEMLQDIKPVEMLDYNMLVMAFEFQKKILNFCRWWQLTMAMVSAGMLVGCSGSLEDSEKTESPFRETGSSNDSIAGLLPLAIDPQILEERRFMEAPMLAQRVLRGELPPVSQRLPETPLVVVPVKEIGRYGGEIRRALSSEITDEPAITKTLNDSITGYERPLPHSIQPNLAQKWEFRDGGKIAIFELRIHSHPTGCGETPFRAGLKKGGRRRIPTKESAV